MELLTDGAVWVAILGGGVAVKVLDYVLPFLFGRDERRRAKDRSEVTDGADERGALRKDIEYLRGEIESLRKEVEDLEKKVQAKSREVSIWQRRYWEKRIKLDRVIIEVNHHGDEFIMAKVHNIMEQTEAEAVDEYGDVE